MRKIVLATVAVGCLGVGAVVGLGVGYGRWHRVSNRPFEVRQIVVEHHAAEMPKGGAIVLGDSLVERLRIDDLCGPTLNAGVGNAQVIDLAPMLPKLLKLTSARTVITEIGTNDLYYKVPVPTFIKRYRALVRSAAPARVIIVGIPGKYVEANEALKKMAAEESAEFIEGFDNTGLTTDGDHFNVAGGIRWKTPVAEACRRGPPAGEHVRPEP